MTFLQGSHDAMLHGGVTLLSLLPPPWGFPQTASGAAAPGKARWRRSFLEELPFTSRHKSRVNSNYLTQSPRPDPIHSWCIREGSRWWPCRVNSVGARQLPQPGISLWTDAIHCAVCWLLRCTIPTAAQRPACRTLCLRLLQALNGTESKAGH